jgi:hypothetical protein
MAKSQWFTKKTTHEMKINKKNIAYLYIFECVPVAFVLLPGYFTMD